MLLGQTKAISMSAEALPRREKFFSAPVALMASGALYNAALAILNAHGLRLNEMVVIVAELLIVMSAVGYIVANRRRLKRPTVHYAFFLSTAAFCTISMVFSEVFFIRFLHDMFLICVFVLLGSLTEDNTLIKAFRIVTWVTLFVLLVELISSDLYVSIFGPASYYENTRGVTPYGDTGLFRGATVSSNRFSFGIFDSARTSSVFLEQVSLANFSMILAIFTASFWEKLLKWDRLLFLAAVFLVLVSNNTRTGTAFTVLAFLGFWVFPKLPRGGQILLIPAVISIAGILFYDASFNLSNWTNDVKGRVGLTLFLLADLDAQSLLTGKIQSIGATHDSGYAYLIYASTIVGMILYWLYTALLVPGVDAPSKRFSYGASLFIAVNLMIGAAIFTIKVSAPLWMLGGYLYREASLKRERERKYVARLPTKG